MTKVPKQIDTFEAVANYINSLLPTQPTLPITNPYSSAVLSDCGKYRYKLTRVWDPNRPVLRWIMLNPSTADHTDDDPTIRKVVGFSERNGFGSIEVFNLFAYRATDPSELRKVADPIGPENHFYLSQIARPLVLAWGNHGAYRRQGKEVLRLLNFPFAFYLGTTQSGQPRHPLYIPYSQSLKTVKLTKEVRES